MCVKRGPLIADALLASVQASMTAKPGDGAVWAAYEIGSGADGFVVGSEIEPVIGPVEDKAQSAAGFLIWIAAGDVIDGHGAVK